MICPVRDVTHVRKCTRPSPALPYCKRREAGRGPGNEARDFKLFGDNTARNDKFHRSIIDRMTLVHVQPRSQVLKAATATKTDCQFEGYWGIVSILKSLQKQLQRRRRQRCLEIDTVIRLLMFFGRSFYRF